MHPNKQIMDWAYLTLPESHHNDLPNGDIAYDLESLLKVIRLPKTSPGLISKKQQISHIY